MNQFHKRTGSKLGHVGAQRHDTPQMYYTTNIMTTSHEGLHELLDSKFFIVYFLFQAPQLPFNHSTGMVILVETLLVIS